MEKIGIMSHRAGCLTFEDWTETPVRNIAFYAE